MAQDNNALCKAQGIQVNWNQTFEHNISCGFRICMYRAN